MQEGAPLPPPQNKKEKEMSEAGGVLQRLHDSPFAKKIRSIATVATVAAIGMHAFESKAEAASPRFDQAFQTEGERGVYTGNPSEKIEYSLDLFKENPGAVEKIESAPSQNVASFFADTLAEAASITAKLHPDSPTFHHPVSADEFKSESVTYYKASGTFLAGRGFYKVRELSMDGKAALSEGAVAQREERFPDAVSFAQDGEPYDYQRYRTAVEDGVLAHVLQRRLDTSGKEGFFDDPSSDQIQAVLEREGIHLDKKSEILHQLNSSGWNLIPDAVTLRRDPRHIFDMLYSNLGGQESLFTVLIREAADAYRADKGHSPMTDKEYKAWTTQMGEEGSTKGYKAFLDQVGPEGPAKIGQTFVELVGMVEVAGFLAHEEAERAYDSEKAKEALEEKEHQETLERAKGLLKKMKDITGTINTAPDTTQE